MQFQRATHNIKVSSHDAETSLLNDQAVNSGRFNVAKWRWNQDLQEAQEERN